MFNAAKKLSPIGFRKTMTDQLIIKIKRHGFLSLYHSFTICSIEDSIYLGIASSKFIPFFIQLDVMLRFELNLYTKNAGVRLNGNIEINEANDE